jgi:hypothetical protein
MDRGFVRGLGWMEWWPIVHLAAIAPSQPGMTQCQQTRTDMHSLQRPPHSLPPIILRQTPTKSSPYKARSSSTSVIAAPPRLISILDACARKGQLTKSLRRFPLLDLQPLPDDKCEWQHRASTSRRPRPHACGCIQQWRTGQEKEADRWNMGKDKWWRDMKGVKDGRGSGTNGLDARGLYCLSRLPQRIY